MINRFCYLALRLLLLILVMFSMIGHATSVIGTVKVNGAPFTGSLIVTLAYPGSTGTYINLPVPSGPINVINGSILGDSTTPLYLDGNDVMLPSKTYYTFDFYDTFGNEVTKLNYYISGSTFDIGQAVPTPILTNNINFLDLLGLRSLSVNNLTINTSFNLGNVNYTTLGINNAQNINNILFAAAYNVANPSSITCGIQEAVNALPATGGIIYLQRGNCTATGTIRIAVPVQIIGFGQGGFADNATFNTIAAGTTITANTSSLPLFSIGNSGTATVSGVTLQGFAISGGTGGTLIQVGQSSLTSFLNRVTIRDVFTYAAPTCAVDVVGNVAGLLLDHDQFAKGAGSGICLSAPASYSVTGVVLRNTASARNSIDGLHVASAVTQDITLEDSHLDNNTNYGVNVVVGSTLAVVKSTNGRYRGNKRGFMVSDGVGSSTGDAIDTNSEYGAYIDVPASTNINFTFKDTGWASNTTADIFTGANTHEVVTYPAKVAPTTSQTVAGTVLGVLVGSYTALATGTNGYWRTNIDGSIEDFFNAPALNVNTTTTITLPHAIPNTMVMCVCSDNSARVQTGNTQAVGCNVSGQSAPYSTVQVLTQASAMTAYCHVIGK